MVFILIGIICSSEFPASAQDFSSLIYNNGNFPTGDPLYGEDWVYLGGGVWIKFEDLFFSGPCTFNYIPPAYGSCYMYVGYKKNPNDGFYYNNYRWGWNFDQTLAATTQNGFDQLAQEAGQNPPRNIAQVRFYERRSKRWKPDGTVLSVFHIPPGTPDLNAIFYADQMKKDATTGQFSSYRPSRLTYGGWHFRVLDHPGLSDLQFHYNAQGNYADVGLYYANFTCVYYGKDGGGNVIEIAPSNGCSVKLLLRNDATGTCASGYQGNQSWSWVHHPSPIADWANPPVGTNFPN